MKRNILRVLQRRTSSTRMSLLKCILDELYGDYAQLLQLATSVHQIMQVDEGKKVDSSAVSYDFILSDMKNNNELSARFAKNVLTSVGYEAALLELNSIIQHTMMTAVSKCYGHYSSPNSPVISSKTVIELVNKYKDLMPVHHDGILTMLNVDKKVVDKVSHYIDK